MRVLRTTSHSFGIMMFGVALTLMVSGCSDQDPSFKEEKMIASSGDGTGTTTGEVGPTIPSSTQKIDELEKLPTKSSEQVAKNTDPSGGGTPVIGGGGNNPGGGGNNPGGGGNNPGGGGGNEPCDRKSDGECICEPGEEDFDDFLYAVDNFEQKASSNKVDILWIVDSSHSMLEEQNYLASNFSKFMAALVASGTDFQTAITTTDICQDGPAENLPLNQRVCPLNSGNMTSHYRGRFLQQYGTPWGGSIMKNSTPNVAQMFSTVIGYIGTSGSGFEHGLRAAQMGLESSLNGQNPALMRADAFLSIIVVSDEEDDGIGLSQVDGSHKRNFFAEGLTTYKHTDDDFIAAMKTIKGQGKFAVSTITGTRDANGKLCSAPHSQPFEEGTQYIKAANKTGGIVQSICDTDWSGSLTKMGQDIAAQSGQFVLKQTPWPETIKVRVNGVEASHWSYGSGNNSVKFETGYIPAVGAKVEISYFVKE